MKKKFIWLIVSCLMVVALVLASCGPEPVVEEKKKVEEPAVGEPQYGGTLTVMLQANAIGEPGDPDMSLGQFWPTQWLSPVQERATGGDFEKYGPRGTGEFAFQLSAFIPEKFKRGVLLESWEISPDRTTWHVRPGIMWHDNKPHVMEARELTAEDIVADLIQFRDGAAGGAFTAMSGDIYASDKYTVVIETPSYNIDLMYVVGLEDRSLVSPPELVAAGASKWENQLGTGPFMLKEYVVGSHMTYVRNPNYWETTTINGVEYEIPFVDEMIWPIIPDPSTQIAALRTGMIDYMKPVAAQYWKTLDDTAPGLEKAEYLGSNVYCIGLKTETPPFDDVNVRRAMMIGTDMKAFAAMQGVGELPIHSFPMYAGNPEVYIPLEELPEDIQLLYKYNPTLAKQMLADAGYPNGFKVDCFIESTPEYIDRAALLEDIWAKIGVEVEIVGVDPTVFYEQMHKGCKNSLFACWEQGNPTFGIIRKGETGQYFNWANWSNEGFDILAAQMVAEVDSAERNRMIREASLIMLDQVPYIPTDPTAGGHYWWPWIKNYYGETNVKDNEDASAVLARVWIDQALKAEMGK